MTPIPTPYQHTRCALALTCCREFVDQLAPSTGHTRLDAHMGKIKRWAEACGKTLNNKHLSAGAKRDLSASFDVLARATVCSDLDGEALFNRWAASIWAALTLLEDCRNTCPAYFKGKEWRWLLQTMTTLGNTLYKLDPSVAEAGTTLYEEAAL